MHSLDAMKISHIFRNRRKSDISSKYYILARYMYFKFLFETSEGLSVGRALLWKKKLSIIYTRHGRCFFMRPNRQLIYVDLNLSCFNNKKLDMFKSMDDRKELWWSYSQWAEHLHEITFCSIYMDVHKPLASSQTTL